MKVCLFSVVRMLGWLRIVKVQWCLHDLVWSPSPFGASEIAVVCTICFWFFFFGAMGSSTSFKRRRQDVDQTGHRKLELG